MLRPDRRAAAPLGSLRALRSSARSSIALGRWEAELTKPIIFFSHSSHDREALLRLKDLFCEKTGGSIEVFLSSDGQSIPLGRNWVHRVEEGLESARLMIVFLTPRSLRSSWIYFEAGYAYSKKVQVVPVGFIDSDLAAVPAPLSLLQGFNIKNADGLDNLVALANQVFGHSHSARFTPEEYEALSHIARDESTSCLGKYAPLVDKIVIELTQDTGYASDPVDALHRIKDLLQAESTAVRLEQNQLESFGLSVTASASPKRIKIVLDPSMLEVSFPLVEKILSFFDGQAAEKAALRFDFLDTVAHLEASHKITAKLFGTGVELAEGQWFKRGALLFSVSHLLIFGGPSAGIRRAETYLAVRPAIKRTNLSELGELISFLFDRKILYVEDIGPDFVTTDGE